MRPVSDAVSALAEKVTLATGWRRALIALVAGAASALAMPPFSIWPVLFVTMPVAVWLLDGASGTTRLRSALSAAWIGFLFNYAYFLAGLWWIGSAFLVDADVYGYLLPVAVAGLPLLLVINHVVSFALARLFWTPGWRRVAVFALAVGLGELARGHLLFTGFPWNSYGYALADQAWTGQFASVIGVEGLTYVAIAIFAAPAVLADQGASRRYLAVALVALAALAAFGAARLALTPTEFDQRVSVRVLQPEIPQDVKSQDSSRDTIMDTYLSLSDQATGPGRRGFADATLTVWPESAFPFLLSRAPEALARIGDSLAPGTTLATGSIRGERGPDGHGARYWNSVHLVGDDGAILSTYDKIHLVPFGEYLPLRFLFEPLGLQAIAEQRGGFELGDRRSVIALPQGPRFRPLICYEAIFPEEVAGEERPDFLLNVTNDAWFGKTPGPYQHAAQARVRAIEQGLPMVRSANGGLSQIVDPLGRTLESAALGERGVVDGMLPRPLAKTMFAATNGQAHFFLPILLVLLVCIRRPRVYR